MATDNTMSAENVKASLETYMYAGFVTANGFNVHWEGLKDLDLNNIDEWVQPRILYAEPDFMGWVTNTKRGWNRPIILNINIFLRKGSTNNAHRLTELRDTVAGYFNLGDTIDLSDHRNTASYLDSIIVRDLMTDTNVPTGDSLYWQWTFSPVLILVQRWTA
jgi:hypothetical protein